MVYRIRLYTVQNKIVQCTEKDFTVYRTRLYNVQNKIVHCVQNKIGEVDDGSRNELSE